MRTPVLVLFSTFLRSTSSLCSCLNSVPIQEYDTRRSRFVQKIAFQRLPNEKSASRHLVIIPAAELQYSSLHVPYPFRQDSYFRYLTGIQEPNALLALEIALKSTDNVDFTPRLFVEERNPRDALWDGPTMGTDGAIRTTGIKCALPLDFFPEYLQMAISDLSASGDLFWFSTPFVVRSKEKAPINRSIYSIVSDRFAESQLSNSNLRNPNPLIDELRLIKSKSELHLMKRAVELTSVALKKTMESAYPGIKESELAARFEFESRLMGSELSYPAVVAGGNRANIIHYLQNSECVTDGQLVLMDIGCSVEGYSADISRTWPINGRFSRHQRLLHEVLVQVQLDCQKAANPESSLQKLYDVMIGRLSYYLNEEKVLNINNGDFAQVGSYICPHHVGHYLGLDVHDTASISYSRKFEPGMVFPLEPGIYFPAEGGKLTVPEEFRGIGSRLEDDYVFTAEGKAEKLNDCVPFKTTDLESLVGSIGKNRCF